MDALCQLPWFLAFGEVQSWARPDACGWVAFRPRPHFCPHAGHWRVHLCFVCLAMETWPELESGSQERGNDAWQRAHLHPRVRAHGQLCAKTQAQVPTSLSAVESDIGLSPETVTLHPHCSQTVSYGSQECVFKLIPDSKLRRERVLHNRSEYFWAQPAKQGVCGLLLWGSGLKVSSAFTLTYCVGHPGHVNSLSIR